MWKNGVYGQTASASHSGVFGKNDGAGNGVTGWSLSGDGVVGEAHAGNKSGVYGFTTDGLGCGGCFASFGAGTNRALGVTGNAIQSRDGGGMVKPMLFLDPLVNDPDPDKKIVRCYNSQATGSTVSTPPCGFHYSPGEPSDVGGIYHINFGFYVEDRFFSVTPRLSSGTVSYAPQVIAGINPNGNSLTIWVVFGDSGEFTHSKLWIIVY